MRTTSFFVLLPIATLLAMPAVASANCYSVYDAQNRLTFQSTIAPIDLSTRISDAMRSRFPGSFLVILPDDSDCIEFRSGPTLSPRFDSGTGSGQAAGADRDRTFEAPLLRGARSPIDSAEMGSATRETIRTGNALNVKRGTTR